MRSASSSSNSRTSKFTALALAIVAHLLKTMCTSRAWRNTIAASYPEEPVRWVSIYASYLAGVGVNAIIPARGGDAVRLFLAHRAVPGSTYVTLGSTLLVLSFFDMAMALADLRLRADARRPPRSRLARQAAGLRLRLLRANPEFSFVLFVALVIFGVLGFFWAPAARRRVQGSASARASRCCATRRRYLRQVAVWQAGDWLLRFVAIWFFLDAFGIEQSIATSCSCR